MVRATIALGFIVSLLAGPASAGPCDPSTTLLPDVVVTSLDSHEGLVYAQRVLKQTASGGTKSGSLHVAIDGVPQALGFSSAKAVSSLISTETHLDYSADAQLRQAERKLSPEGRKAYESCLNSLDLAVNVSDQGLRSPDSLLTINWNGKSGAPRSAQVVVTASNGHFLLKGGRKVSAIQLPISPNGTTQALLRDRNVVGGTEVGATITKATYQVAGSIEIPPYVRYTLEYDPKFSPEVEIASVRAGARKEGGECVFPDEGAILLPETATWVPIQSTTPGRITAVIDPKSDKRRVCGTTSVAGSSWWPSATKTKLSVIQVKVATPSEQYTPAAISSSAPAMPLWGWAAALLAVVLMGGGLVWVLRRRRS